MTLVRCLAGGVILLTASAAVRSATPAPADALGRLNPRSTVTGFLEACHERNYGKAAQYLDISRIPAKQRVQQGTQLAREFEQILNADSHFDVLQLSQQATGNLGDDPDPDIERMGTITGNNVQVTLELRREQLPNGPAIWLVSPETVAQIPKLAPLPSPEAAIEALLLSGVILAAIFRILLNLVGRLVRRLNGNARRAGRWIVIEAILDPALVLLVAMTFRMAEEFVAPSALTRLYIGDALLLAVVWSVAWGLLNLFEVFVVRLQRVLDVRQRVVSRSLIYLARRVIKFAIVVLAAVVVLNNWGFNMTTVIAGLGVGGIAIALAAQQTIANVFGGVSVIGDNPVTIGDFGNFGGVLGTVEEIGMRSTRVRTLHRTVVSVPNAAFAGMNLENYALRDKILFNPTFQIKRSSPKDAIRRCMQDLRAELGKRKDLELVPTAVRINGLSSASFALEIFAYVLTSNIDDYYQIESELLLAIDDVLIAAGVELA